VDVADDSLAVIGNGVRMSDEVHGQHEKGEAEPVVEASFGGDDFTQRSGDISVREGTLGHSYFDTIVNGCVQNGPRAKDLPWERTGSVQVTEAAMARPARNVMLGIVAMKHPAVQSHMRVMMGMRHMKMSRRRCQTYLAGSW
jgi:hypothetical protein